MKLLNPIILSSILLLSGCSTTSLNNADAWLNTNRDAIVSNLSRVGDAILKRATSEEERKDICNEMWSISIGFNSIAGNKLLSAEQVDAAIKQFAPKLSSNPKYSEYFQQVSAIWGLAYIEIDSLLSSKVPEEVQAGSKLLINTCLILAETAQKTASKYVPPVEEPK